MQNHRGELLVVKAFAKVVVNENGYRLFVWMKLESDRHVGLLNTEERILGLGAKLRQICKVSGNMSFQMLCPEFSSIITHLDQMEEGVPTHHEFCMFVPDPAELEEMKTMCCNAQLSPNYQQFVIRKLMAR